MGQQVDREGLGAYLSCHECETVHPPGIPAAFITRLNWGFVRGEAREDFGASE